MTEKRAKEIVKCFNDYDFKTQKNIYAFLIQANLIDDEHSSIFSLLLDVTAYMQKKSPDTVKAASQFINAL